MVPPIKESYLDLENDRQLLQDNLEMLVKSMRHWQLWEAEYEGLKEEILAINPSPIPEDLRVICDRYDGKLVTKKEVNEILGTPNPRNPAQVINLLDRRIEYVERNVCTIQNQIQVIEKKIAAVNIVSNSEVLNEESLPLTEIREVLDDHGNVIATQLSTPGNKKSKILGALRKAGVQDFSMSGKSIGETNGILTQDSQNTLKRQSHVVNNNRTVSFEEVQKPGLEESSSLCRNDKGRINYDANFQVNSQIDQPVIPSEESAEDAALRREMLQYGMLEVDSVVAELEIEENSDYSNDDLSNDSFDQDASSSDEEDVFGRYTGRVVSDEMRQHMIELEQRMSDKVMKGIHKKASNCEVLEEGIGRITLQKEKGPVATSKEKVRFSDQLEIFPTVDDSRSTETITKNVNNSKSVKMGSFFEGVSNCKAVSPTDYGKAIHSEADACNLKSSESIKDDKVFPRISQSAPLATTIIEREIPLSTSMTEPDKIESNMLRQEIAREYYTIRNRMIQRQGGFMKEEESERVEFTEAEGGPKKISRFKAARISRP